MTPLKPWQDVLALVVFAGILFFFQLGERDLSASHEARAAQDAQMIVSDGDWGLPRLYDQKLELQKPPLYYWLVAIIAKFNGSIVNGWAVRLPAAMSALGTVLLLAFWGQRTGKPGVLAGFILASCLHFTRMAHVGRVDMPLTFMVTLAVIAFSLAMQSGVRRWLWSAIGYVAIALGILLKGPIALIFVAAILSLDLAAKKVAGERVEWRGTTLWWGLPLTAIVAAPWFIWANIETHNKIWEVFFWYHNLERGLGTSDILQSHPWWFYFPRTLSDLFPWSLLLPFACWTTWRMKSFKTDGDARLGAAWFLAVFAFLSLMSFKRSDYLLPAYPGAAIFLAIALDGWMRERSARETRGSHPWLLAFVPSGLRMIAILLAVYVVGWLGYFTVIERRPLEGWPYERIAQKLRAETEMPVIFFRAESHLLAFHVGRPLDTILEWENLEWWATRPDPIYIVMPPDCAASWQNHMTKGRLEPVLTSQEFEVSKADHPFVVMKSFGESGPAPASNVVAQVVTP